MYMKKITAVLLFLFLMPYCISIFWPSGLATCSENNFCAEIPGRIVIDIKEGAGVRQVFLENYILGILPGAMPVSYEPEALKAQAVLLRTRFIREYEEKGKVQELEGISWLSVERMKALWGAEFENNYAKLEQAVNDTKGLYLLYDGQPILASYFRVSNGHTRNGNEILGNEKYPYLAGVACEKDFLAEDYLFQKEMQASEVCARLGIQNTDLHTLKLHWDEAGYCTYVSVGETQSGAGNKDSEEQQIRGERFRILLGLPSSGFDIRIEGKRLNITVKGIGHGLGMSQFAANEMAKNGTDFMTILSYFFTDIAFDKFE